MLDIELWGRVIVWSDKSGSMAYQRAPADGFTRTNRGSDMILQWATREVDVLRAWRLGRVRRRVWPVRGCMSGLNISGISVSTRWRDMLPIVGSRHSESEINSLRHRKGTPQDMS